eukprot:3039574-Amphidinium_carterae.1
MCFEVLNGQAPTGPAARIVAGTAAMGTLGAPASRRHERIAHVSFNVDKEQSLCMAQLIEPDGNRMAICVNVHHVLQTVMETQSNRQFGICCVLTKDVEP